MGEMHGKFTKTSVFVTKPTNLGQIVKGMGCSKAGNSHNFSDRRSGFCKQQSQEHRLLRRKPVDLHHQYAD